jgi:hypothetical protein
VGSVTEPSPSSERKSLVSGLCGRVASTTLALRRTNILARYLPNISHQGYWVSRRHLVPASGILLPRSNDHFRTKLRLITFAVCSWQVNSVFASYENPYANVAGTSFRPSACSMQGIILRRTENYAARWRGIVICSPFPISTSHSSRRMESS